jgi:hypothetical protein
MTESRNVQIPIELFDKINSLIAYISLSKTYIPNMLGFNDICSQMAAKQKSINLHALYSKGVYAKHDDEKRIAFDIYHKVKSKRMLF